MNLHSVELLVFQTFIIEASLEYPDCIYIYIYILCHLLYSHF